MTDIQIQLVTEVNLGDHGEFIRKAFTTDPGETVEHLVDRLFRLGEFAVMYRSPEPPTAHIEIRYVEGTTDPAPVPDEAPF